MEIKGIEFISHHVPAGPAAVVVVGDCDEDGNRKSSNDDCINERDVDDRNVHKSDRRCSLPGLRPRSPCPLEGRAQRPGSKGRSRHSRK